MALTEQEEFELLSLEREKALQEKSAPFSANTIEKKGLINGGDLKTAGAIAGLGGIGAIGAAAAIKAKEKYGAPMREVRGAETSLRGMQRELGIEGLPFETIGQKLQSDISRQQELGSRMLADVETQGQLKRLSLESAKRQVDSSVNLLNNQLKTFDDTIIRSSVDELAKNIKMQYPSYFRSASANYGKGLQAIEAHFDAVGGSINTLNFDTDVIGKTISQATNVGVTEEGLQTIKGLQEFLRPKADKTTGIYAPEKQLSFSQAKKYVSDIVSNDPYSTTSRILRDNWGEFLENNSSGEVRGSLSSLNSKWRKFKQAQSALVKLSDPVTGEFNTSGLNKWIVSYTKDRIDDGITDLMEYVSSASEITSPMKGTSKQWESLNKLLAEKFGLKETIKKMEESQRGLVESISQVSEGSIKSKSMIESSIRSKVDSLKGMLEKYKLIIAKMEAAGEKLPFGKAMKFIKGARKIVRPTVFGFALGALDPTNRVLNEIYGTDDILQIIKGEAPSQQREAMIL